MSYLERKMDLGGERDYIDGVAIHAGQFIQAKINGTWFDGRYEANWRRGSGKPRRIGGIEIGPPPVIEHAAFYYHTNDASGKSESRVALLDDTIPVRLDTDR